MACQTLNLSKAKSFWKRLFLRLEFHWTRDATRNEIGLQTTKLNSEKNPLMERWNKTPWKTFTYPPPYTFFFLLSGSYHPLGLFITSFLSFEALTINGGVKGPQHCSGVKEGAEGRPGMTPELYVTSFSWKLAEFVKNRPNSSKIGRIPLISIKFCWFPSILTDFPLSDQTCNSQFESDNGAELFIDVVRWGVGHFPGLLAAGFMSCG